MNYHLLKCSLFVWSMCMAFHAIAQSPAVPVWRRNTAFVEAAQSTRKDTILYLNLSERNLTAIPEWVYECTNLRSLDLSRNPIGELPRRLNRLKKLHKITCDGISISPRWVEPDSLLRAQLKKLY